MTDSARAAGNEDTMTARRMNGRQGHTGAVTLIHLKVVDWFGAWPSLCVSLPLRLQYENFTTVCLYDANQSLE